MELQKTPWSIVLSMNLRNMENIEKSMPLRKLLTGSLGNKKKEALDLIVLLIMILWIRLCCRNTMPSMVIMEKSKGFVETGNAGSPTFLK